MTETGEQELRVAASPDLPTKPSIIYSNNVIKSSASGANSGMSISRTSQMKKQAAQKTAPVNKEIVDRVLNQETKVPQKHSVLYSSPPNRKLTSKVTKMNVNQVTSPTGVSANQRHSKTVGKKTEALIFSNSKKKSSEMNALPLSHTTTKQGKL